MALTPAVKKNESGSGVLSGRTASELASSAGDCTVTCGCAVTGAVPSAADDCTVTYGCAVTGAVPSAAGDCAERTAADSSINMIKTFFITLL